MYCEKNFSDFLLTLLHTNPFLKMGSALRFGAILHNKIDTCFRKDAKIRSLTSLHATTISPPSLTFPSSLSLSLYLSLSLSLSLSHTHTITHTHTQKVHPLSLRELDILSGEINLSKSVSAPSDKDSSLLGKNLLPEVFFCFFFFLFFFFFFFLFPYRVDPFFRRG